MSLQTRLSSLITAIGADIKSLSTRVTTLEAETPATGPFRIGDPYFTAPAAMTVSALVAYGKRFFVPVQQSLTGVAIYPTTATGNVIGGLYSDAGAVLKSSASAAVGTANTPQGLVFAGGAYVAAPGFYWRVVMCSAAAALMGAKASAENIWISSAQASLVLPASGPVGPGSGVPANYVLPISATY